MKTRLAALTCLALLLRPTVPAQDLIAEARKLWSAQT